jgi:hypothetical protein
MQQPFAFVSASLVATEPYLIKNGDRLHLRYGIWAHAGRPSADEINSVYTEWCR